MLTNTNYCYYYMSVAKNTDFRLKVSAEVSGLRLTNTRALTAVKNALVSFI